MLAKKYSLSGQKQIAQLAQKGRAFFAKEFLLKARRNKVGYNRYCIVISTKVSKKAVARNKVRRRVRAHLARHNQELAQGFDVMIVCRTGCVELSFEQTGAQLEKLLIKARLQKGI